MVRGRDMRPAQRLVGHVLDGGWRVLELVDRGPDDTGGHFSVGYIIEGPNGRRAFLKALDYSRALASSDPARELLKLTAKFVFERDVLDKCRAVGLSRIVVAIQAGKVVVDTSNQAGVVEYLIFELADGDVRKFVHLSRNCDLAWTLRCLHHVATALGQLHGQRIAHQDLKPSNVMVYGGVISKVGDLGSAAYQGHSGPHDEQAFAGDPSYAPPELLYKQISPDWNQRRFGCDAYLLGSMTVFMFTGSIMSSLLLAKLDASQHWREWRGSFAELLPQLRQAFGASLLELRENLECDCRDEVVEIVRQLCDPDPGQRGHPRTRASIGNPYSLERYISWFDRLARRAELARMR